jgi:hypothetical protein
MIDTRKLDQGLSRVGLDFRGIEQASAKYVSHIIRADLRYGARELQLDKDFLSTLPLEKAKDKIEGEET